MPFQLVSLFVLLGWVTGAEAQPITSSCPTSLSLVSYVEERKESESIGIDEIVKQAAALVPATGNSSVPTVEAAYKAALAVVDKEDNPENAAEFYEALGEITKAVYRSCFGEMPIALDRFSSVKKQFEQALRGRQINQLREAYGLLLCLKHLSETDDRIRKRSTASGVQTFFDSIDADEFRSIFFLSGDPYSVAFIIDDTGSMADDIEAAKCLVRGFLNTLRGEPAKYILGTFNDPGMYMCMMIWILNALLQCRIICRHLEQWPS